MDLRKVEFLGVVKYLWVSFVDHYPYRIITMDITIIDVPNVWGILSSIKFVANIGWSIQMNVSYAIIPATIGGVVISYRESKRSYHIEMPQRMENGE